MAEAIAVVSVISAMASLVSQFAHLSIRLNHYTKHIKYARTEIMEVDLEISQFTILLKFFKDGIGTSSSKKLPLIQAAINAGLPSILSRHSEMILGGANNMLSKLKPLRDDKASSWVTQIVARLRWAFERDGVKPLKLSLISIKMSLNLFLTILQFSEKEHEIHIQAQAGQEILVRDRRELRRLKNELECWRDRCEEAEKKLSSLRSSSSPTMPPVTELSHAIETLITEELSRQRKQRRQRGSNPSTSPTVSPIASTLSRNGSPITAQDTSNTRRGEHSTTHPAFPFDCHTTFRGRGEATREETTSTRRPRGGGR